MASHPDDLDRGFGLLAYSARARARREMSDTKGDFVWPEEF